MFRIKGASLCSRFATISIRNLNNSAKSSAALANNNNNFNPAFLYQNENIKFHQLTLQSNSSNLINEIGIKHPLWRKEIFELPITNKVIQIPTQINNKVIEEITNIDKTINLPTGNKNDEGGKQAARLIQIRKRKMRKHKLRKLRKRMKFVWGKAKQRREWKKEKKFLNGLLLQIKEAQKFSAEEYVAEEINKATADPPPQHYRGHYRMPQWLIRQLLEKDKQKEVEKKYKFWEESGKN